jgi:hypothetical protein
MKWRVVLELVGADGTAAVHEVSGGAAVAEYTPRLIGLTLAEGTHMLAAVQRHLVEAQTEDHCRRRRRCQRCGLQRHVRAARQYQGRSFEVLLAQVSNDGGKQVVFSTVPVEANSQTRRLRGVLGGLSATPATPVTVLSDGADGPRSLGEAASPGQLITCSTGSISRCGFSTSHRGPWGGPIGRRRIVRPVLASPRRSNGSVGVSGMVRSGVR